MGEVEVTEDVTEVVKGSGSLPMMVEQGFLDLSSNCSIAQVVVVLAEAVPSWLFLTPLLGRQTLVVYMSKPVAWFDPPPHGGCQSRV